MNRPCPDKSNPIKHRRGATATELVVAATLLVSLLGTLAPLAIAAGRIRRDARHYQLGLEELSNQLDRLGSLDGDEREAALDALAPSEDLSGSLPDATLSGEVVRDEDGTRLVLRLDWKRPRAAAPVQLVGWLDALPAETADASSEPSEEDSQ